jgi:hypothetical protein
MEENVQSEEIFMWRVHDLQDVKAMESGNKRTTPGMRCWDMKGGKQAQWARAAHLQGLSYPGSEVGMGRRDGRGGCIIGEGGEHGTMGKAPGGEAYGEKHRPRAEATHSGKMMARSTKR